MSSSEQSNVVTHSETEINSDSNIIPYSQYVIESQQATVQNSNSSAKQDALILSMIEQLKTQVVNCTKINLDNKSVNDSLTAELERYKEQVKVLKEEQNVDLRSNDTVLDSSAQSVEIDHLKQTLFEHLKENKSLMKTKAQQLEPKLYDGNVIKNTSDIMIPNSEETLMLAEESQPTLSSRPTKVEVPKELPKVSMVNTSLKKIKYHLAGFDVVVKERTTPTAITKGSWGKRVLEITALKNDLRKLKGKALVDNVVTKHTIDPKMLKIDMGPITPKLLNKRTAHSTCIEHTQEETAVLRDLVIHVKANYPLDHSLESVLATTPKNRNKRVRFTEPVISLGNTITKTASTSKLVSNKPMLSSTGVKPSTSDSRSQPSGNINKDKIRQTPSSTQKNKVEVHPRKIKSSLKNKDCVVQPKGTAHVQHSNLNANHELKCVKCNGCMLSDNHDLCVLDFINNVNARQTFTIVGNACPLTRITTTAKVPLRKPTALENETPKPVVTLVYLRKPRKYQTNVPVSKSKVLKSVSANKKEPCQSWGSIVFNVPSSSLDECRSSKLFSEGLGHNLFFVGQFCDSNLEVAFRQHTYFIRNLEGVDLLTGSRGNNLYTLSLRDMMVSSSICLLSKASKTKHGLVRGLPKLKFRKDHTCSAYAMGKSKKKPHIPKSEDTNQEKLYLLHMDLFGPMRVASVNGKKYILVIIDDYSRFTWVKCLRSKDEAPDFIIKFLKMIQVQFKTHVRCIRTDNGTEFVNQTLREYYEKVGISHETSVARSPQQNGVIERRNRTLIKAARTMLIYAKALLFLWAEVVATACYTQNCSIVRLCHRKTPYELLHDKPPDLSFFHVFGALYYPTNDSENLDFDEIAMASELSSYQGRTS
ncbi:retrovirus-related pol polyprotein from transposon TNT 1-94 [Tanacetum coccineum]